MMELKIMEPAAFAAADLSLFTVVDMREEGVPPSLRIPGAVEIPFSRWFSEADKIPKEKPVLLLCQIGKCSELAGEIMADRGYDVSSLRGGFAAYYALQKKTGR